MPGPVYMARSALLFSSHHSQVTSGGGEQESATVELLILQTPANIFAPLLEPAVRH